MTSKRGESINAKRITHRRKSWNQREFGGNVVRLAVLFVALAVYSWFRKTYFPQSPQESFSNALEVIDWQRTMGIGVRRVELPMQEWVLERESLIHFFNFYYQNLKPALYLSAILCLLLRPLAFRRIWLMCMIVTLLAIPWYAIYPLAPPRFMEPFGYPFVDTLAVYGDVHSSNEGVGGANQFAAMPSMHIGWTTFAALWLAAALPRWRIGAVLGGLHLGLMCMTVIVTGNHYVLDIVGGFILAGLAIAIGQLLLSGRIPRWWRSLRTSTSPAVRRDPVKTATPRSGVRS